MNALLGKKIKSIWLAKDRLAIKFEVDGAEAVVARADGDCCSNSWIENVERPESIVGKTVIAVDDVDMPRDGEETEDGLTQFYGCKVRTENGEMFLDYRNASNGYYGGNLYWPDADKEKWNYFYGGVFGQNVSKEEWEQIA